MCFSRCVFKWKNICGVLVPRAHKPASPTHLGLCCTQFGFVLRWQPVHSSCFSGPHRNVNIWKNAVFLWGLMLSDHSVPQSGHVDLFFLFFYCSRGFKHWSILPKFILVLLNHVCIGNNLKKIRNHQNRLEIWNLFPFPLNVLMLVFKLCTLYAYDH